MGKESDFIPFEERSGDLPFTLLNDYLFKIVFQSEDGDYEILRAFLSALLDLSEKEITKIEVMNSIIPGEAVNDKTVMLDIRLEINENYLIDLELQVKGEAYWKDRSLFYLSRLFSRQLKGGQEYGLVKPAHHIGIVDFDIKDITPKFYSVFNFCDVESGEIYSRNLTLSVLNLKRTDLAVESDKARRLDTWAKVFKATTWEELQSLAKKTDIITKVSKKVAVMTEEQRIREQLYDREMAEIDRRAMEARDKRLKKENSEMAEMLKAQKEEVEAQKEEVKALEEEVKALEEEVEAQKEEVEAREEEVEAREEEVEAQKEEVEAQKEEVKALEERVKAQEEKLSARQEELSAQEEVQKRKEIELEEKERRLIELENKLNNK